MPSPNERRPTAPDEVIRHAGGCEKPQSRMRSGSKRQIVVQPPSKCQSLGCDTVQREFKSNVRIGLDNGVVLPPVLKP
jgi:hypothetical protein